MTWLPNLKSCIKAFLLFLATYSTALVLPLVAFWFFLLTFLLMLPSTTVIIFLWISLGAFLIAFTWFFVINIIYSLFLKLLWKNPPKQISPPKTFKKKLYTFLNSWLSSLSIATICIINIFITEKIEDLYNSSNIYQVNLKALPIADTIINFSWLWLICCAFIYQYRYIKNKSLIAKENKY